jgi:hypothetical protein
LRKTWGRHQILNEQKNGLTCGSLRLPGQAHLIIYNLVDTEKFY